MSSPDEEVEECTSNTDLHRAVGKLAGEVLEGRHEPPRADSPRMTEGDWREVYLTIGKLTPKKS